MPYNPAHLYTFPKWCMRMTFDRWPHLPQLHLQQVQGKAVKLLLLLRLQLIREGRCSQMGMKVAPPPPLPPAAITGKAAKLLLLLLLQVIRWGRQMDK